MLFVLSGRVRRNVVFVLSTSLLFVANAMAADLTYSYTGTVTTVPSQLTGSFEVGDPIFGSYTFDDTWAPNNVSEATNYNFSVSAFSMDIDGYSFSSLPGGDVSIGDNVAGKDTYTVVSLSAGGTPIDGLTPQLHALQLEDSSGSALSSTEISLLVNPADFDNPLITVAFGDGVDVATLMGQLTSAQVTSVPEPSGVALLLFGMLTLPFRLRKRKR